MRHQLASIAGLLGLLLLTGAAVCATAQDVPTMVSPPAPVADDTAGRAAPSIASIPAPAKLGEPCVEIVVTATEFVFGDGFESGDTGIWDPDAAARFSAVGILDLNVTVYFVEGFGGEHVVHLKLTTPKGHHYQTISAPVTSNVEHRGGLRRIDGYPRPLAVRVLEASEASGLPYVTLSFPVGGTPIVTSSLFGTWTAEASLDEGGVCASVHFELTP